MPNIYNKDSSISVPQELYDEVANSLTYLIEAWSNLKDVITVNEVTMDTICPPEKVLDPHCVKKVINSLESKKREGENPEFNYDREFDELIEGIYNRLSECSKQYRSLACYDSEKQTIYICPERIWKNYQNPDYVFKFVLLHEIVHAYLGGKYKSKEFPNPYKIIEESLCNAVAFYHIDNKTKILGLLLSQPAEYQCYTYWLKFPKEKIPELLDLWWYAKSPINSIIKYLGPNIDFEKLFYFEANRMDSKILPCWNSKQDLIKLLALVVLEDLPKNCLFC